ncbi:MAG TPA: hypothetical protein GX731_03270 [Clostridiales bacterium]|nr:hypothetical protein [Clostridiales bacterium]
MKKVLIVLLAVVSVSLFGFLVVTFIIPPGIGTHLNASAIGAIAQTVTPGSIDYTYIPPALEGGEEHMEDGIIDLVDKDINTPFIPATEIDRDPESITVFVNKEYNLPKDYVPKNMVIPKVLFNHSYADERQKMRPEAASALEDLFEAAKEEGLTLYGISAYRSYDRQRKIFLNNIVKKGKYHTLRYSAVPGTSEHQTGLSIDVSTKALRFRLVNGFANTAEGKWLADNAHHYGYIVRYPKDKYEITGYAYEPWHIRYVGQDLANYLYSNDLTLDEYYNYSPSEDFNFELEYASLINYVPPVVTTIPEDDPALLDEEALLNGDDQLPEDDLEVDESPDDAVIDDEIPDDNIDDVVDAEDPDEDAEDVVDVEDPDKDITNEGDTNDESDENEASDLPDVEGETPTPEDPSGEKPLDSNSIPNVQFN